MGQMETRESPGRKSPRRKVGRKQGMPPPAKPDPSPDPNHKQWAMILAYVVLMVLALYAIRSAFSGAPPQEVPYSQFMSEVEAGHISAVVISSSKLIGTLKPTAVASAKAAKGQKETGKSSTTQQ